MGALDGKREPLVCATPDTAASRSDRDPP